jgi:hypothetical protein
MAARPQDEETLRQELREIVERLPSEELYGARRYLGYLIASEDPFVQSLLEAPWDDEPLTAEEEALVEEGWRAVKEGDVVSHEEMKRRLGI